jgi:transcriptional regulator with XRE-family HTH domain
MSSFRESMGLSITHLAQLIDVSRSLLSLYEKGVRNLPVKASLMDNRITLLWLEISKAPVKKTAALSRLLQKYEQEVDERLRQETVHAERELIRLKNEMEKIAGTLDKEIMRYNFLDVLSDQPGMKGLLPVLNKSRLTRKIRLKACNPARERWLNYRIELAQAQKQLALKWGVKPAAATKQTKGKLRSIETSSKPARTAKKSK